MVLTKEERVRRKRDRDRMRSRTKVCIGDCFEEWRQLAEEKQLDTDRNVCRFLLDKMVLYSKEKLKGERDEYSVHIGDCFEEWRQIGSERQLSTDRDVCRFLLDFYKEMTNAEHVRNETEGKFSLQAITAVIVKEEREQQDNQVWSKENDFKGNSEIATSNCMAGGAQDLECDECLQSFKTQDDLDIHNCNEALYNCSDCKDSFPTNAELALHQRMYCKKEISAELLVCDTCGEVSDSQRSLRQHKRIHSAEKSPAKMEDLSLSEYSDCNSSDSETKCAETPERTVREKNFKCKSCKRSFASMLSLQFHEEKIHNVEESFRCHQCDKEFLTSKLFIKHMKSHDKKHPFTCHICSKTFPLLYSYKMHVQRHAEIPFQCSMCGGKYISQEGLYHHIQNIHSEKQFICEVCAETFRSDKALIIHRRLHTGEKPFPCSKCDKAFTSLHSRQKHDKRHHEGREVICEECGKGFGNPAALKLHKLIHTGERPHQCQFCDKAFNQPHNLKVHMRKHTEEKPYKCDICNQRFRYNLQMKQHKTTAHKIQEDA